MRAEAFGFAGTLTLLLIGICTLAGYFVYGGWTGLIATLLTGIILSFIAILGVIPVVGVIAYYFVAGYSLNPIMNLMGIYPTWLTSVLYWGFMAVAIFYTYGTLTNMISRR